MKNNRFYYLLMFLVAVFCHACSSQGTSDKNKPVIRVTKTYNLNTELSSLKWVRNVDYIHITKKLKVFGVYADVSLDNVQLETSGESVITGGNIIVIDDIIESGIIEIDLSLTRFYSDEEESFFVNETYPPAKLTIQSFIKDSISDINYLAKGSLTLNDKTMDIEFPAQIDIDENSNLFFKADYLMQTSDWDLLKQPKPENVNYDKINFSFNLVFDTMVEKTDTVSL
ncbi:MAG: YceI family protein [Bacteroidales bacterium]|nr:YceI family protein [Bacteroidales bacterium]